MLADHTTAHTFQTVMVGVGAVLAAVAYGWGTIRRARNEGQSDVLQIAEDERNVWRERATRFEADLTMARVKCAEDIGVLSGKVERLEAENFQQADRLAKLSPEVLIAAMTETAEQNRRYYSEALDERLHPIEQGIDRLLTQRGAT